MRNAPLAALLMAISPATVTAQAGGAPFDGRFVAEVQGQVIEFELKQSGTSVQGLLQAPGGQPTTFAGKADGLVANGIAGNDSGVGAFEARRNGDALSLVLTQVAPDGTPQQITLAFQRAGSGGGKAQAGAQAAGPPANGQASGTASRARGGGDPRLVGLWRKSESYTSGSFTAASETFMQVSADGRVAYGAGRVLAGNADVGGDSGRGGVQEAEWRAEGGVLSLRAPGGAWQVVGRYQVSDAGMLIYLPNGSKELWYRQ